jgi:integrase
LRERTLWEYRQQIRRYVVPYLGLIPLQKLTLRHIQDGMISALEDEGLSPKTIRHARGILYNALRTAVRMGLLASNPAADVELPRSQKREMQALTPEELGRLFDATLGTRYHAYFKLAADSGGRPGELLASRWEDLDFERGRLAIRRSLQKKRKGQPWKFEEPKTQKGRRTIDLMPSTIRELRAHRKRQAEEKLATGSLYVDRDLIFATATGSPLDESNLVKRHFKPALEKAGLPTSVRLYDLRHATASMLIAAGIPANVVSERLGHSRSSMTWDNYVHAAPNAQSQAAERMEELLSGQG